VSLFCIFRLFFLNLKSIQERSYFRNIFMALLSLQQISLRFGGPLLLDKVDLQLERAERVCLIGRNGEGKSTLLKLINGES